MVETSRLNGSEVEYEVFFGGDFNEVHPERNLTEDVDDVSVLGRLKSWSLLDADGFPSGAHDAEAPSAARAEPLLVPRLADRSPAVPVQAGLEAAPVAVRADVHRRRGRSRQDDRSGDRDARAQRAGRRSGGCSSSARLR